MHVRVHCDTILRIKESIGGILFILQEYRRLKQLRRGPMTINNLRRTVERYERTGTLFVQLGQRRKCIKQDQIEKVATAIIYQAMENKQATSSDV